jgi:hypothetical protein
MRKISMMVLTLLNVLLLSALPSFAQDEEYAPFEIFGGYSFVRLGEKVGNMDGWNASFTGNINSVFGIKGEVSGIYAKFKDYEGVHASGYSFMAGPQITGRFNGPVDVFGHALFGIEHAGVGANGDGYSVGVSTNAFAMALGGGLDWHKGRWGIRVPQIDYFPWRKSGATLKNVRVSAGVVFRLGGE